MIDKTYFRIIERLSTTHGIVFMLQRKYMFAIFSYKLFNYWKTVTEPIERTIEHTENVKKVFIRRMGAEILMNKLIREHNIQTSLNRLP